MEKSERLSPRLSPDRIRDLVVGLEQHGLESSRIDVVHPPARSMQATSRVDQANFARPVGRAAVGAAVGAVAGGVLGALLMAAVDGMQLSAVLLMAIAGAILAGLAGLYVQLPVNTDVVDVDAGGDSIVRVDVSGLESERVREIEKLIGDA